jgi:protease-4
VRILRFIGNLFKAYFMSVGIFVTLLPVIVIYLLSRSSLDDERFKRPILAAEEKVLLTFPMRGTLVAKSPDVRTEFISRLTGDRHEIHLSTVETALRRAKQDKRVLGLYFDLYDLQGDLNLFNELRDRLVDFKSSGKPVYFSGHSLDTANYFLASVGDEINVNPAGNLEIPGPVMELVYFKDALDKLGVEVEVIKEGKFKSAMEPLVENSPSEATREMYESIETHLREYLAREIAGGRKKNLSEATEWLKRGLFSAGEAVSQGLANSKLDEESYREQINNKLEVDSEIDFRRYINASESIDSMSTVGSSEKIALIEAMGTIYWDGSRDDENITPRKLNEELDWALEDNSVKAVVLRIDSPGGSALASDVIAKKVAELHRKKPVVASFGSVAASGGYYIAAPASKIFAEPTTITGSIGVISAVPNGRMLGEKWGIHFHTISSTDRKDLLSLGSRATDEDKALLAAQTNETYKQFLTVVAEGRSMTIEEVAKLAEGRVYSGIEASKLRLIDGFGGLNTAFAAAKQLAGLDEKKLYEIARYDRGRFSFFDCVGSAGDFIDCLDDLQMATKAASLMRLVRGQPVPMPENAIKPLISWARLTKEERILALALAPYAR